MEEREDAIISCKTNTNTTANIFFSTTPGFNYQNKPTLVIGNSQQTNDTLTHNARISNFQDNLFYYYVIVAIDEQGDITVSDEYNFKINLRSMLECAVKIICGSNSICDDVDGRKNIVDLYLAETGDPKYNNEEEWPGMLEDWAIKSDRGDIIKKWKNTLMYKNNRDRRRPPRPGSKGRRSSQVAGTEKQSFCSCCRML